MRRHHWMVLREHLRLRSVWERGSSIRRILLIGFAAIFGLWLSSAYVLGQRVIDADRRVAAITREFAAGEDVLSTLRERVLLSSVLLRDAALDTGRGVTSHRDQLRQVHDDVARALDQYLPYVDSPLERDHWRRLRTELDEYWTSLSPLLAGEMTGSAALAFVRGTIIPKRTLVLQASEQLRVLNQDALRQQQAAVSELHRAARERLWWTSGLAVAFGFAVALVATTYIGRLEFRIRQQHTQELQHKRELQRLSAELDEAQENERRTIARDLHDEIGQALMTIKLDLGVVDRSGQTSGAPAAALAEARSSTDQAIHTVRNLSHLLHPPMLDDFGLVATLQAYVRGFTERTGVQTELVLDRMEARVPPEIEVCAYRIVQEALTNVAKHADASSCRVYLQQLPYSLLLTIEDDGKGIVSAIAAETQVRSGVGLVGVRERVARVGGTINLESTPGSGTRLTAELPMPHAEPVTSGDGVEAMPTATDRIAS
jgi:signal transduction histidine kinase